MVAGWTWIRKLACIYEVHLSQKVRLPFSNMVHIVVHMEKECRINPNAFKDPIDRTCIIVSRFGFSKTKLIWFGDINESTGLIDAAEMNNVNLNSQGKYLAYKH